MSMRRRHRAQQWMQQTFAVDSPAVVVVEPRSSSIPRTQLYYSMAPSKANNIMATADTTYGMSMDVPSHKKKGRHHRRGNSNHSEVTDDGSASLTYSAGSSIASSAAGESTDSSFADIMRVLDVQDSNELAAFMKREGVTDPSQLTRKSKSSTAVSVTSSLQYSTDGESALEGVNVLSTITG